MDTDILARLKEIIQRSDKIAIAVGRNASVDDMAAALSLYLGLSKLRKTVTVSSPAQPLVEHSSLVGIDKLKMQLVGDSGDLIVSFPYKEGEIEKVSYTLENGYLNIVVKAGEQGITFKEQDVRFSRGGGAPQLLIIVGTPNLSDLGSLFDPDALKDTQIINIDNKTNNQGYGDVVYVSTHSSSVSEMIAEVLRELAIEIDIDIAQNILLGLIYATQNFQHPQTTMQAFEVAASMMKKGATRRSVPPMQSEDRVSGLMPEQMISQSPMPRIPQIPKTQYRTSPPSSPFPPYPQQAQQQVQPSQPVTSGRTQPIRDRRPPADWLTPRVYKGSSNF